MFVLITLSGGEPMEMTKQLVLRLPENVHRELKILAATNGQSMTEMILNWLKDKVQGLRNKTEIDPVLAALTDPITPQERRKLREYSDEEIQAFLEEDAIDPALAARIDRLLAK